MSQNKQPGVLFSIKSLLRDSGKYLIPIYQRNYAWGEKEITQLIQDIIDYVPKGSGDSQGQNYYLGTLVVYERKQEAEILFETVDGQQRLTTLSLLASVLKNKFEEVDMRWFESLNLSYESRKLSSASLEAAFKNYFDDHQVYNESLRDAYELTERILRLKLQENDIRLQAFFEYFFQQVKILRIPLPESTELNHYFEIMNNRGEQLEKHEVLKSKLLEVFSPLKERNKKDWTEYEQCFHLIWEACSNMEKYVQYGFTPKQRQLLFGANNWNQLEAETFDEICDRLRSTLQVENEEKTNKVSITDIISGKIPPSEEKEGEEQPERFNSVINFPNFLLHVLRIHLQKDIPLDDKRLITLFNAELRDLNKEEKITFVKSFAYQLLRLKFLFDKYVLKREFISGKDRWSLKRLKWYEDNKVSYVNSFAKDKDDNESVNRKALMLLAMFHVSTPTMVYKHWLSGVMNFLYSGKRGKIDSEAYIEYLENLAAAFVFDRHLAKEPAEYFDIIFDRGGNVHNTKWDLDKSKLRFGQIPNNLIFNYLDYLLWKEEGLIDSSIRQQFEYTFRSSVEHYYPQHPMEGQPKVDEGMLHSFGNLCLISHSKNSRLSNLMPISKKEYYANNQIDSLKQHIMMEKWDPKDWREQSILEHGEEMAIILFNELAMLQDRDNE